MCPYKEKKDTGPGGGGGRAYKKVGRDRRDVSTWLGKTLETTRNSVGKERFLP